MLIYHYVRKYNEHLSINLIVKLMLHFRTECMRKVAGEACTISEAPCLPYRPVSNSRFGEKLLRKLVSKSRFGGETS